ncbi:MAG: hypothetical protein IKS41_03210 [Alphaproteobacteria bacterium]|nr:hypothetical protein [Alphaproteobacteria bacterium]
MINGRFTKRKMFTNDEIVSSLAFLAEIGRLSNEELKERGLKIGEAQKVNHFLSAVSRGESTCLPKQATTLLRLTPLLLERGSNTVHFVLMSAAPRVIDAYQKATDLEEKRTYADAIKTAGMISVSRRLGATTHDNRVKEFQMFEPFIGETPEYREAKEKFMKRNRYSKTLLNSIGKQATGAVRINPYGRRYTGQNTYE